MPIAGIAIVGILAAYLLGGFPSAIVIGKGFYGVDVREHGSHNMGTTNTLRVLGFKPGVVVAILDVAKGCLGVLVMRLLLVRFAPNLGVTPHDLLLICSGLAAILGHLKSPYLHFTGGKGAATAFGVLVVIIPWSALVVAIVWFAIVFTLRIVSVATMAAAASLLVTCPLLYRDHPVYMVLSVLIVVLIFWAHRANIGRLRRGEEKKLTIGHAERKERDGSA